MVMNLIQNKKVHLNYELLENFEGGLELFGHEVKSIKDKQGSLEGSHIVVRGAEVYLVGSSIPAYQPKNVPESYDPERPRKILVTRKEIKELADADSKKGVAIVPVALFTKGRKIKISFAIARGKKKFDKREDLKKRDAQRDIDREMKGI